MSRWILVFASLPLPNIKIDYVRKVLTLWSNWVSNPHECPWLYLSDEHMAQQVWNNLNEKKRIVFLHPTFTMIMNQDSDIELLIPI